MPAPDTAVFDRLSALAAIDAAGSRPQRTIDEVFTGAPLGSVPVGTAEDVAVAVARARAAQPHWAARPAAERARVLHRFRDAVVTRRSALMDVIQAETGKARWAAQEEVMGLMFAARYFARVAPGLLDEQRVPGAFPILNRARVGARPCGVVAVIAPWNYPLVLSLGDAIPALLAGNAVVLKPDSRTPFSALAGAELLYRAGLPRDLLAVVPGPGPVVGEALVDACDYLMFTGSTRTGRAPPNRNGPREVAEYPQQGGQRRDRSHPGTTAGTLTGAAAHSERASARPRRRAL
ncbi:aldehyde dehydrogenase family protein, partial [Nocardia carnea]|uniref:aldehyde dehydrogenase family protein n=1 Tax=Nocardia carnea TaxID=37328 RepID=UPI002455BE1F